jgi:hypothetical protein
MPSLCGFSGIGKNTTEWKKAHDLSKRTKTACYTTSFENFIGKEDDNHE